MRKLRKVLSVVMAFVLLVTGIQVSGLTANAETEWTETAITSIKYEVSVSGGEAVESFVWKTVDGKWTEKETTVALKGDGDYTIEVACDSASGMVNLGYIVPIDGTAMTVTVNKIVVNGYELAYETAPVLQAGSGSGNGLANIWSGLESGTQICGSDNAYFVFEVGEASSMINFYVGTGSDAETKWTETAITSVKFEVTVANAVSGGDALESFDWEVWDANWNKPSTTVALDGAGDYTIDVAFDSVAGLKNLGFINPKGSEMTVTVNKVIVNGYELTYETTPVLKDFEGSNGLANIWNVSVGTVICGNDNAYLALDKTDGAIQLYVSSDTSDDNSGTGGDNVTDDNNGTGDNDETDDTEAEWVETAITSLKYEVSVAGADVDSFTWTVQDGGWNKPSITVALNGDGNYTIEVGLNSAAGMKNLGYIEPIDSAMTVTIDKVIVNGYELTYETVPVLKTVDGSNALSNIWNASVGTVICGSDNAYLALDKTDGAIQLYIKQTSGSGSDIVITDSTSLDYVKAMGDGWNLGNSFDGVNTGEGEADLGETAWGNPVVTKEVIQAAAKAGYDSIRIPITFYKRFDEETYELSEAWLARCKEVIQWALDENLYVMINVHHDSWIWLEYWDGNKESEEYKKFTAIWEQYAEYFKDLPEQVCFETINEPVFEATGDITAQDKLDMVNQAAYDAIRNSGGNNATRMIVIPTYTTNHGVEHCKATVDWIDAQDDNNLIATVHYYSEWVHSAGIGKTGFDEVLWQNDGVDYTPRDSVDLFYETLQKQFLDKGIGVIVGEWGLLGYDSAFQVNQAGEELKYYEYMNYYANKNDVCLMFWDNGSGISRTDYTWKKPLVGEMLMTSMSERSAYVTGLDRVFLTAETDADLSWPLTLNGLEFEGIKDLAEGTDYTYDEATATVTLSKNYVNAAYAAMGDAYGTFAELVFQFSGGADWHEYLIKYTTPVMSETTGTTSDIAIPVEFKGSEVRRATAYMASGRVGPNSSWWNYLQCGGAYLPDYEDGTIAILDDFWKDSTVTDGEIVIHFEMYDGTVVKYTLVKSGTEVTGYPTVDAGDVVLECADEICVYVGETAIKDTYLNVPKGTRVYGTYTDPGDATDYITLTGWPAQMTFGTVAQEGSIKIGLRLDYMDLSVTPGNITFWLKDAPTVSAVTVDEGSTASVVVSNLAKGAKVTYEVADTAVATVTKDGILTGVEEGTTKVIATVTQYGRTDSFEATVTVNHVCVIEDTWTADNENHWHGCECGVKDEASVAAHTVENWVISKAPTKDAKGEATGSCSVCEQSVTKEIPVVDVADKSGNACNGQIADLDDIFSKIPLTKEEAGKIAAGDQLKVIPKILDVLNTIAQDVKDQFLKATEGKATIGTYLDITLFKQIGDGAEVSIEKLNDAIKISVELPENLKNTDANVKRTYSVWRMHGDGIKELATSYDKESNTLTFETDRFSTYVIAYSDTTINSGNTGNDSGNTNATVTPAPTTSSDVDSVPKTGDTNELIVWFAFMVVAGIGAAIYGFKNRKETSEE